MFSQVCYSMQFVYQDFLYETIDGGNSVVIKMVGSSCQGIVNIPSKVIYNNQEYIVKEIESDLFYQNDLITEVYLPNTIEKVRGTIFNECSNLERINVPSKLGYGNLLFRNHHYYYNCSKLNYIEVDKDNPYYISEDGVVYSKDKTKLCAYPTNKDIKYQIPSSVLEITHSAFEQNLKIEEIVIQGDSRLCLIDTAAFMGCINLKEIKEIPVECVLKMGAFNKCESLHDFDFSKIKKLEESCFEESGIKNVNLEKTLSEIPHWCFMGCKSLETISLPYGITYIGDNSITWTKMKYIILPASLNEIHEGALYHNKELNTIVCRALTPPALGYYALNEIGENVILYVPDFSVNAYKASSWGNYISDIRGLSDEELDKLSNDLTTGIRISNVNANNGIKYNLKGMKAKDLFKGVTIETQNNGIVKKTISK